MEAGESTQQRQTETVTTQEVVRLPLREDNISGTATQTAPFAGSRKMTIDALGSLIEVNDGGIYKRTSPESENGDWVSLIGDLGVSEVHNVAYDTVSDTIITGTQGGGTQYQFTPDQTAWVTLTPSEAGDVAVDTVSLAHQKRSIRYSSSSGSSVFDDLFFSPGNSATGTIGNAERPIDFPFGGLGGGSGLTLIQKTTWDKEGHLLSTEFPALDNLPGSPSLEWQQNITPIQLNNVNPHRMVIGGANGLYESFDQGETVSRILANLTTTSGYQGNPLDYGGRKDGVDNKDVIYAGDAEGTVWVRKQDFFGNLTFVSTSVSDGAPIRDVIMNTEDYTNAFAITDRSVFRTSNMGDSWTDITGDLFGLIDSTGLRIGSLLSLEFMPGLNDSAVVVGTNIGVFASLLSNPEDRWFELGASLPNAPVWDLDFDPADDVMVVGTLGRGAWKLTDVGGDVGVSINELRVTSGLDELSAAGVPFSETPTLREAINQSNLRAGQQLITIDPSFDGQAFELTLGELAITDSVVIDAAALDSFTIRAGDPTPEDQVGDGQRIFAINNGDDQVAIEVVIRGLTLTGGDVDGEGGAIRNRENLTLDNVTFTNNHATQIGGALSHRQGALTVTGSHFEGNSNGSGHGGAIAVWNANHDVLIQNTSVHKNRSMGDGGGLDFLGGGGQIVVDRVTVSGNEATDRGGGIWAYRPITVISSTISGNSAGQQGGGIWTNDLMHIDHSTIVQNQSAEAGGGALCRHK